MPSLDDLGAEGPDQLESAAREMVRVIAVMAVIAGVRACICMIAVPTLIVVWAAIRSPS